MHNAHFHLAWIPREIHVYICEVGMCRVRVASSTWNVLWF